MKTNTKHQRAVSTKILRILNYVKLLYAYGSVAYVFGFALHYNFETEVTGQHWVAIASTVAYIMVSRIIDWLMLAWGWISDRLVERLQLWPKVRTWILLVPAFAMLVSAPFLIAYWKTDSWWKPPVIVVLGLVVPSALISTAKEDVRRRNTYLAQHRITPDLIAQNPQAAIENAFTHFEDHLRQRLNAEPNIYGEALINLAFGKAGQLRYSTITNEQQGMRNFVSGAYATFRNPRKHRIVEDDQQNAQAIVDLVELLIRLVDEAEVCPPPSKT